jgi:hypothetical protein
MAMQLDQVATPSTLWRALPLGDYKFDGLILGYHCAGVDSQLHLVCTMALLCGLKLPPAGTLCLKQQKLQFVDAIKYKQGHIRRW